MDFLGCGNLNLFRGFFGESSCFPYPPQVKIGFAFPFRVPTFLGYSKLLDNVAFWMFGFFSVGFYKFPVGQRSVFFLVFLVYIFPLGHPPPFPLGRITLLCCETCLTPRARLAPCLELPSIASALVPVSRPGMVPHLIREAPTHGVFVPLDLTARVFSFQGTPNPLKNVASIPPSSRPLLRPHGPTQLMGDCFSSS